MGTSELSKGVGLTDKALRTSLPEHDHNERKYDAKIQRGAASDTSAINAERGPQVLPQPLPDDNRPDRRSRCKEGGRPWGNKRLHNHTP